MSDTSVELCSAVWSDFVFVFDCMICSRSQQSWRLHDTEVHEHFNKTSAGILNPISSMPHPDWLLSKLFVI